jgi:hypothetical protein
MPPIATILGACCCGGCTRGRQAETERFIIRGRRFTCLPYAAAGNVTKKEPMP